MSFVLSKTSLKKILIGLIFSTFMMAAVASTAHADWWDDLWNSGEEEGLSFTQYTGQLAELSSDGFDQALVDSTDLKEYIIKIVNFALTFLGLIAVLIVVYGGVLYVTAAGEDEKVGKAKKAIGYAAIGLLIVLGSYAFVNTIIKGASGEGGSGSGGGAVGGSATAITTTQSFNAAAEQVKALAAEIYQGYKFLVQTTEELKFILNDIRKDSLKPGNLPSKQDMTKFLGSATEKLLNLKSKVEDFSTAQSQINNMLRDIDSDIDTLNQMNQIIYVKYDSSTEVVGGDSSTGSYWSTGGTLNACNVVSERDKQIEKVEAQAESEKEKAVLADDILEIEQKLAVKKSQINSSDEYVCVNAGYPNQYIDGLYEFWQEVFGKYSGTENTKSKLDNILEPFATDYYNQLKEKLAKLDTSYNYFKGIEAIGPNSKAGAAFVAMKGAQGFGFDCSEKIPCTETDVTKVSNGFLDSIENWILGSAIDKTGNLMNFGMKKQFNIYEELKKLKFVQARLTANVTSGPAPLVVTFDALKTMDPAGGSIDPNNIIWDLAGTQKTADFLAAEEQGSIPLQNDSVDCYSTAWLQGQNTDAEAKELIGQSSKRCVFSEPGTYNAAVKIDSNDPAKYAPGISVLTIRVKPPTTRIELDVQASGETEPHHVMHYENDQLLINEKSVSVTSQNAANGITFDASKTPHVKQCKWNFGNGDIEEFGSDICKVENYKKYKEPGEYEVTLEVINNANEIDRKIFNLKISSIAARIKAKPETNPFINESVTFDGSGSKSDLGKIVNYSWTIKPSSEQSQPITDIAIQGEIKEIYPDSGFTESGGNLKTLTHAFKFPLNYDITLEVKDDGATSNTSVAELKKYRVISHPPVAKFDYSTPDKSQPSKYYFDGSKSFDPDNTKNFSYEWSIEPAAGSNTWDFESGSSKSDKKPIIRFKKKQDFEVKLKVTDQLNSKEFSEITKTVKVDNILDVSWKSDQLSTAKLNDQGKATIIFNIVSPNADTYDIDFGDNEDANGELKNAQISHTYTYSGKFKVKVTVTDSEGLENHLTRNIYIGGGDKPTAKIRLSINGEEIQDLPDTLKVSKKDVLTFDGGDSRNTDGTSQNLKYSWNFGDGKNSSKQKAIHTYKNLSLTKSGYYTAKLTVYDDENPEKPSQPDELNIEVKNLAPTFSSIQGTPQPVNSTLITPVSVAMKVYGAEDPDGEIVKYKWWYFEKNSPDAQFGVQITNSPSAKLTIGTRGKQGDAMTYGFGLEITDSDGLVYSNKDTIASGDTAKLEVINGANALPKAKFNVNSTSIFAGDKVVLTSSSTDPDGFIDEYIWDIYGDGFFNDEPTSESSIETVYEIMNKSGFDVRLKVIDDKGGESISEPIKIHVDSLAKPPTASFTTESIPGSDGMKIRFVNTSKADEEAKVEILSNQWDFDTESKLPNADSDGDGKKDNDIDSQVEVPERLFTEKGTYKVKLTVTDTQGNRDEVINDVKVPLANPPLAAFTYELKEGEIIFQNTSSTDVKSGSIITKHLWDFDLNNDSDGDGKKDNDTDSQLQNPTHTYAQNGTYKVKLTVVSNEGGTDEVTNDVNFSNLPDPVVNTDSSGTSIGAATINNNNNSSAGLLAVLTTDPAPGADSMIILSGTNSSVKFDFSKSAGAIQYYSIDKNIYFDTDGNGNKTDDQDFKTSLPGTWTTNFDKSWGKIVVKLTVLDIKGNQNSALQEIKF